MHTLLLSPPIGCLTHPSLSLPSLTASLRSNGHYVEQCDMGIRVIDRMLSATYLSSLHRSNLEKEQSLQRKTRTEKERVHLRLLKAANLFSPDVIARIEDAKAALRSQDRFYQPAEYRSATNAVRRALEIISAASFPTKVSFNDVSFGKRISLQRINELTTDRLRNPFLDQLSLLLPDVLAGSKPDVVGISATYYPQLVTGYSLARLIRAILPDAHIVMGGSALTSAEQRLRSDPLAFDWVDSYVFGEGETALNHLLAMIESDFSISNPYSKLFRKTDTARSAPVRVAYENGPEREDFSSLPTPDYDGLDLQDYLSPEPVLLLSNARGCYHRKCAFCNVSLAFNSGFQQRSLDALQRDIHSLQKRHGARFFFFADDCVPPSRCREIADVSAAPQSTPFFWQTEVRFEKQFDRELFKGLAQGGCLQLIFGNESGNQRTLDRMCKGTDVQRNRNLIRLASEEGIAVHLQNFLGFPGETIEEGNDTIELMLELREYVASFALGTFHVSEYSPVHQAPDSFGVRRLRRVRKTDLIPHFSFSTDCGTPRGTVESRHAAALKRLNRVFPFQDHYLDGPCGAHLLLHLAHFKGRVPDQVLPLPFDFQAESMLGHRPIMASGIMQTALGRDKRLLYSRDTCLSVVVDARRADILGLADGAASLDQLCAKHYAQDPSASDEDIVERSLSLALTAVDLQRGGFLEFL